MRVQNKYRRHVCAQTGKQRILGIFLCLSSDGSSTLVIFAVRQKPFLFSTIKYLVLLCTTCRLPFPSAFLVADVLQSTISSRAFSTRHSSQSTCAFAVRSQDWSQVCCWIYTPSEHRAIIQKGETIAPVRHQHP